MSCAKTALFPRQGNGRCDGWAGPEFVWGSTSIMIAAAGSRAALLYTFTRHLHRHNTAAVGLVGPGNTAVSLSPPLSPRTLFFYIPTHRGFALLLRRSPCPNTSSSSSSSAWSSHATLSPPRPPFVLGLLHWMSSHGALSGFRRRPLALGTSSPSSSSSSPSCHRLAAATKMPVLPRQALLPPTSLPSSRGEQVGEGLLLPLLNPRVRRRSVPEPDGLAWPPQNAQPATTEENCCGCVACELGSATSARQAAPEGTMAVL